MCVYLGEPSTRVVVQRLGSSKWSALLQLGDPITEVERHIAKKRCAALLLDHCYAAGFNQSLTPLDTLCLSRHFGDRERDGGAIKSIGH